MEAIRRVNCGTSCNGILFSNKKKTTRHGGNLKPYDSLKEAIQKRPQTVGVQLMTFWKKKKKNYGDVKRSEIVRGLRRG